MDKMEFCYRYCPMAIRLYFRNGDYETDCSSDKETDEGQYCPFENVNFEEVTEQMYIRRGAIVEIGDNCKPAHLIGQRGIAYERTRNGMIQIFMGYDGNGLISNPCFSEDELAVVEHPVML